MKRGKKLFSKQTKQWKCWTSSCLLNKYNILFLSERTSVVQNVDGHAYKTNDDNVNV